MQSLSLYLLYLSLSNEHEIFISDAFIYDLAVHHSECAHSDNGYGFYIIHYLSLSRKYNKNMGDL